MHRSKTFNFPLRAVIFSLIVGYVLSACAASDPVLPTPLSTTLPRQPTTTPAQSAISPSSTTIPSPDVTATADLASITPLPWDIGIYTSEILWDDVEPVEYLEDQCEYVRKRWDPEKSVPGTIVAPIMFHSVRKSGRPITDDTSITEEYFDGVLNHAQALGFRTITIEELIAFLKENALIPKRSMIMILDDRRPGVTERFIPYLNRNDWMLTLGWIVQDQREYLWTWMEYLAESGRLDVQSHGYWHRYIVDETSEDFIREELFDPIPILEEHFGYRPRAFIWPGGNFTTLSVEIAHEADYEIAFTANAQGPLMYNWIPQGESEREVGDPLFTLPRYWSTTSWRNLDETVQIADGAIEHAQEHYAEEAEWFKGSCAGELPPLPDLEDPSP